MVEIITSKPPRPSWWRTHANRCGSSVLNLPPAASDYEIRDRYRQLSIQYHPDKQRDESAKEIASKQFLKIQKAYQGMSTLISSSKPHRVLTVINVPVVLSDPFLRCVQLTLRLF